MLQQCVALLIISQIVHEWSFIFVRSVTNYSFSLTLGEGVGSILRDFVAAVGGVLLALAGVGRRHARHHSVHSFTFYSYRAAGINPEGAASSLLTVHTYGALWAPAQGLLKFQALRVHQGISLPYKACMLEGWQRFSGDRWRQSKPQGGCARDISSFLCSMLRTGPLRHPPSSLLRSLKSLARSCPSCLASLSFPSISCRELDSPTCALYPTPTPSPIFWSAATHKIPSGFDVLTLSFPSTHICTYFLPKRQFHVTAKHQSLPTLEWGLAPQTLWAMCAFCHMYCVFCLLSLKHRKHP